MHDIVRWVNRRSVNKRRLRKLGIAAYRLAVRLSAWGAGTPVLLNGIPKSGTHLLSDCLSLLPNLRFSGLHFALSEYVVSPNQPWDVQFGEAAYDVHVDASRLKRDLAVTPRRTFTTCHCAYNRRFAQIVQELGFQHLFMVRDPRAILLSDFEFITNSPWHHHHAVVKSLVASQGHEAALRAMVRGIPIGPLNDRPMASLRHRLMSFLPWLHPNQRAEVVRFEELVGARGGGSDSTQSALIDRIATSVHRDLPNGEAARIGARAFGGGLTFNAGQVDRWRVRLPESIRSEVEADVGDLLVRMGYGNEG